MRGKPGQSNPCMEACTHALQRHVTILHAHLLNIGQHCCLFRLEERLQEHSQISKARAMRQLRQQLCQIQLEGTNSDLDWSILSLLFSLSTRPLDSAYPSPQPQRPTQQQQQQQYSGAEGQISNLGPPLSNVAVQRGDRPADSDAEFQWEGASDLSDWSCDDDEQGVAQGAELPQVPDMQASTGLEAHSIPMPLSCGPAMAALPSQVASSSAETWLKLGQLLASSSLARKNLCDAASPRIGPERGAACLPDDLVPCLARVRLGAPLPLSAPPRPQDCCSDGDLVHQALSLLLGACPNPSSSAGAMADPRAAFVWDARLGRPVPRRGLHVPYLSPSQLGSLLGRLAEAGGQVRQLMTVAELPPGEATLTLPTGMLLTPGGGGGKRAVSVTPCLSAFLTAQRAQLHRLVQPLISLQQQNLHASRTASESVDGGGRGRGLTLFELLELTEPVLRRVQLLHATTAEALAALPQAIDETAVAVASPSASACVSGALLDSLHSQLQRLAPVGGPAFQSHHQVLLHLYLCTLVPMLEGMQSWLYNSDSKEDSLPLDFFIRPGDM